MYLTTLLSLCCILKLCAAVHLCPPTDCSLINCSPATDCKHGFARDRCACCEVCLRHSGERCGGKNKQFGICADGLYCAVQSNKTSGIGICQSCIDVKCEVNGNLICPHDSYKLVTISEEDVCCQTESCVCLPDACQKPVCSVGKVLKLLTRGNGSPGACCDHFDCIQVPRYCFYGDRKFANGQKWQVDNCTNCVCQNGIHLCKTRTCNFGNCNQGNEESNECCPRCEKGCIAENGIAYHNNDTWFEDACTSCQCINGHSNCIKSLCDLTNCLNPRMVDDQCCPQCEDCDVHCKYGYKRTDSGKELCECKPAIEVQISCLSLETCRKQCLNGFELSHSDCSECRCKSCRNDTLVEPTCDKKCRNGFQQDTNGCFVCECILSTTNTDYTNISADCIVNGVVHKLIANDSCRQCTCDNGMYVCSETLCANQTQTNAKNEMCVSSECGNYTASKSFCAQISNNTNAISVDSNCLNCTCRNGQNPFCVLTSCPAAACETPVISGAGCCPYCNNTLSNRALGGDNNRGCEWNGKLFTDGQQWRKSLCESCVCRDGLHYCYHENCSQSISCKNLVYFRNRCCPLCLDFAITDGNSCVHNNVSYRNGQSFELSECWHCFCYYGKQICENLCDRKDCFGDQICHRRNSDLMHLTTIIMLLTVAVLAVAVLVSCIAKRSHQFGFSSISWPSTSSTHTNDDRGQRCLNISYSKIDVCEKAHSIIEV